MVNITRHVGKIENTGQKCVIVYRALPEAEAAGSMALIVQTDQLPDMMHDNLMEVLNSAAAQQTHDLFNVLNRRKFGDGSNMLQSLHFKGFLKKVPVDNVILYPMPNRALPLRKANVEIGTIDGYEDLSKVINPNEPDLAKELAKDIPINEEVDIASSNIIPSEDRQAIAAGLLAQATLMEDEAKCKREEAYTIDPALRPSKGRPALSEEEVERRKVKKNKKRREEYALRVKEGKEGKEST